MALTSHLTVLSMHKKNGQGELARCLNQVFLIWNTPINLKRQKKFHVMSTLTEKKKKPEIWHSLTRSSMQCHNPAERIRLNAKLLQANKTQKKFMKHFIPEYLWGTGESDQTLLAGRSVEFKIKKLQLIAKNLHSPKQVSWTKWNRTWVLNIFILFVLCALKFKKIMQLGFHIFFKRKS